MDADNGSGKKSAKEIFLNNQISSKNVKFSREVPINSIKNNSTIENEKNKINEENNKLCLKNIERSLADVMINNKVGVDGPNILKEFINNKFLEDDVKFKRWNHRKKNEIARERWKMLAKALSKPKKNCSKTVKIKDISVRRFTSFELITPDKLELLEKIDDRWLRYNTKILNKIYGIDIHYLQQNLTAKELIGFNNTGNICIWPSEEVLTYYVLSNLHLFEGKEVLEVGGGMTCLAGISLGKYGKPAKVHLTDGNTISVDNVRKIIAKNQLDETAVSAYQLNWNDYHKIQERFDVVLSADCLFFDETRSVLVETIWHSLKDGGVALVMAPRRGNTLDLFVRQAVNKGFCCILQTYYDEIVWKHHVRFMQFNPEYDEDIHYPILLILTKSSRGLLVLNCLSSV